jgi:hypothetical protein
LKVGDGESRESWNIRGIAAAVAGIAAESLGVGLESATANARTKPNRLLIRPLSSQAASPTPDRLHACTYLQPPLVADFPIRPVRHHGSGIGSGTSPRPTTGVVPATRLLGDHPEPEGGLF